MINHKSRVSEDLPDYLLGNFELRRPAVRERLHARGRKAVLRQVSGDAPATFLLPFVQPATPSVRKAMLLEAQADSPPRDIRLLSDLHTARHSDYSSFHYVDFDPSRSKPLDYSSLPLSKGTDLEKGTDAGTRLKLPFYEKYVQAAAKGGFNLRMGMFSHRANQKVIGRADANLKISLLSSIQAMDKDKASSQHNTPREIQGRSPNRVSLTVSRSRPGSFDWKAMEIVLKSGEGRRRMKKHFRTQSVANPTNVSQEIDSFDQQRLQETSFHPVTKKTLGTIF